MSISLIMIPTINILLTHNRTLIFKRQAIFLPFWLYFPRYIGLECQMKKKKNFPAGYTLHTSSFAPGLVREVLARMCVGPEH